MSQRSATNPRNTQGEKTGTMRRSVARAKPKTAAASTVRLEKSDTKSGGRALTKEERKRAEQEERNDRNRNMAAINVLLKKDPVYSKWRVVWGVVLGMGLAPPGIVEWTGQVNTCELRHSIKAYRQQDQNGSHSQEYLIAQTDKQG